MDRCLYVNCPIAAFTFSSNITSFHTSALITDCVALGARSITSSLPRCNGFDIGSGPDSTMRRLICTQWDYSGDADNNNGGSSFSLTVGGNSDYSYTPPTGGTHRVEDCIAYNFSKRNLEVSSAFDAAADSWSVSGLTVVGPEDDLDHMIDASAVANIGTIDGSTYWTTGTADQSAWFERNGTNESLTAWNAAIGETNQTVSSPSYSAPGNDLETYMTAIGSGGDGYAEFMRAALDNRRGAWDWNYSAYNSLDHIRAGFDMQSTDKPAWHPDYAKPRSSLSGSFFILLGL